MKIGIDIRNIGKQRTGSETVVLELTKNLLELDKENEYFMITDSKDAKIIGNIKDDLNLGDKKNYQIVSLWAPNKFIWALWSIPLYLIRNKIDFFHNEYIVPFFIPKRTKVITHIHDVSFRAYRQMIKKRDLFFLDLLIPRSIWRSDKIIAVSQFTKEEILKYYKVKEDKIEVVFNSINLKEGNATEEEKNKIKEKYALPDKFILYLGTLQPRKNIALLIEAYAKLKDKIHPVKLVLAGNRKAHNFDKKIDEILEKNKLTHQDVIFTGYVDTTDKALMYRMAHVFVFPSLYEGFGIPILEAMSQGLPVIASDIGPHREVMGESGVYFPPEDIDILADKLYNICVNQEEQKRLSELGLERNNLFSWKESAQKMLDIFNSFK